MILDNVIMGFQTALTVDNLMYSFIGVFVGNLIGVLPGIGALAAISMLLHITYGLHPAVAVMSLAGLSYWTNYDGASTTILLITYGLDQAGALMMLAGLYYGTSYGGATTTILLNLPGTATHAVVCLDGHPMARQGRAGPALLMAMLGSFIGATIGIIMLTIFGPLLVEVAFQFGPAEYFSLMFLGLLAASTLSSGSPLKGISMVLVGLIFGAVGTDVNTGVARFTFGIPELQDGLALIAVAMGLFGIADVIANANRLGSGSIISKGRIGMRALRFNKGEFKSSVSTIGRGAGVGSFFGILPGTGGTIPHS